MVSKITPVYGTSCSSIDVKQQRLELELGDGHRGIFAQLWLRDTCSCASCVHPVTKQRTHQIGDVRGARLKSVHKEGSQWRLHFTDHPSEHVTVYEDAWLRDRCQCDLCSASKAKSAQRVLRSGAQPWPSDWRPVYFRHEKLGAGALPHVVEALWRDGLCVVSGLPRERGMVERFAERLGYLRETNYGRIFDVEAVPDPEHLAYTGVALPLHTDNPYREPSPGIQLLHCIDAAAEGGESLFSDGFAAAQQLACDAPDLFEVLRSLRVPFRYRDSACDHQYQRPLIATVAGSIDAIYFNDRSMQPLLFSINDVEQFYHAYAAFEKLIEARKICLALQPGELVLFDNRRVLHGRKGFSVGQNRRLLQGCYMDWDAVLGRARMWGAKLDT
jgi:gamma-butyrobetaine dioxygenase